MSVLETPRIAFGGQVSWDPIVTNNYANEYNEAASWISLDFDETVEEFRQDAISSKAVIGNGNWNPQGTHRSNFFDTEITSVDLGGGAGTKDTFVSCPVLFQGMLVDCEPYGGYSSQLFFDQMSFGIDGGCRIFAPRTSRFTARYINFFRLPRKVYGFAASVASVVWQSSFSKADGLKIDAFDSAALKALDVSLKDDDVLGLTVRFNAYATHYYGAETSTDIPALEKQFVDKLAGGGFQPNPARSTIVGVIGLWRKGEPAHEPGDRALLAAQQGPPNFVASLFARLDASNKLTIDMANSISEIDLQQNKQDLGPLAFSAVDTSGNETVLGTIDYSAYSRDAYRMSSGIVTMQLDANQAAAAAAGSLAMKGKDGTVYLTEVPLRAIPDDPNLYIDAGDNTTTNVIVLDKGVPAGSGISVAMELDSASVAQSTIAATNADGVATFDVVGAQGQVQGFVLNPYPDNNPTSINTQLTTYIYIRTLQDPAAFQGAKPPDATWENVFQYCLSNWYAMAPCMDNWLDLKDEAQVRAYAPIIKMLTDPANFESFRFMPVTRDMTLGERQLLYTFLDGPAKGLVGSKAAAKDEPVSQAELSRQMRHAK